MQSIGMIIVSDLIIIINNWLLLQKNCIFEKLSTLKFAFKALNFCKLLPEKEFLYVEGHE
jgi:hypothetical protein